MTANPIEPSTGRPLISRPPTVVLTEENTRHLRGFPRPPRDNGIGLHFHLDLRDDFIAKSVEHLQEIRATWTLIYAGDELQTERAARACFSAGIMPVVRPARLVNQDFDPLPFLQGLRRAWRATGWGGPVEPLYLQLYNEPEDPREWTAGVAPADGPQRFGSAWAARAPQIVDAGAFVGIQVLDRPGFDAAVDAVARNHRQDIWQRAFFVQHNYGQNHPPAYPYDPIKQQVDPGTTILQDHIAALKFLAHATWMQERLGFVMPVIGGEGGWWMYDDEDKHYPKVDWPLHAQYHKEMYEWFRNGVLSNGEATPDYLFSITSWIAGSWTFAAQNWWDNPLSPTGKLDLSIEAMRSIPEFVRRFSWDDPNAPPTVITMPPAGGETGPSEPGTETRPQPGTGAGSDAGGDTATGVPTPPQGPPPAEKPPAPPMALEWDERLDSLGVCLDRTEDATWRLVKAEFWDDEQSGGRHHIYVKALRKDGKPAEGITFLGDWVGREPGQNPGRGTTDANGETNVPMFVPFDPTLRNGIMFSTVEGARADVVRGMGLPFNHNVCFILTFQEV